MAPLHLLIRTDLEDGNYPGNNQDDDSTDTETKQEDEYRKGQFDNEDYEGIVITLSDILYNVQEQARIPWSWILFDSQSMWRCSVTQSCYRIYEMQNNTWYYIVMQRLL